MSSPLYRGCLLFGGSVIRGFTVKATVLLNMQLMPHLPPLLALSLYPAGGQIVVPVCKWVIILLGSAAEVSWACSVQEGLSGTWLRWIQFLCNSLASTLTLYEQGYSDWDEITVPLTGVAPDVIHTVWPSGRSGSTFAWWCLSKFLFWVSLNLLFFFRNWVRYDHVGFRCWGIWGSRVCSLTPSAIQWGSDYTGVGVYCGKWAGPDKDRQTAEVTSLMFWPSAPQSHCSGGI